MRLSALPRQMEVLRALDAAASEAPREIVYYGGLGAGKTQCGFMFALRCMAARREPSAGFICMRTGPAMERGVIREFLQWLETIGVAHSYNKSKRVLSIGNAACFFQTLDIPHGELKGPNLSWAWIDEADTCPRDHVMTVLGRVRAPGPRATLLTANPVPTAHWLAQYVATPHVVRVQSATVDNPRLPPDYIARLLAIYPPGTPSYRRWVLGEMGVALEGAVYPEWTDSRNVRDAFHAHHEIAGIVYGLDFGYNNPTAFLSAYLTHDDVLVIDGEHYAPGMTIADHVAAIRTLRRDGPIVADHDAQVRHEYAQHGINTVAAKKDVVLGIDAVRRRIRDGRLQVVRGRAPNLVREMAGYVWQTGALSRDARELPVKRDDHAMDALRYIVTYLDGYAEEPDPSPKLDVNAYRRIERGTPY